MAAHQMVLIPPGHELSLFCKLHSTCVSLPFSKKWSLGLAVFLLYIGGDEKRDQDASIILLLQKEGKS